MTNNDFCNVNPAWKNTKTMELEMSVAHAL